MIEAAPYTWDDDLIRSVEDGGGAQLRVLSYQGIDVVLGSSGRPDEEVHSDAVRADGVPILRRRGGGCAVLLDPGNIVVSVVLPLPGLRGIKNASARISDWLIDGLTLMGLSGISRKGISDLALDDRKVGGSCIYRRPGLLYYSATLLVEPEVALIERYLKHPPREPAYRGHRFHREFLGSLRRLMGPAEMAALAHELGRILAGMGLPYEGTRESWEVGLPGCTTVACPDS